MRSLHFIHSTSSLLAILLLAIYMAPAHCDNIEETSEKISVLQQSIDALRDSIDVFSGKQEALQKDVREAEQKIFASLGRVREVRQRRAELDAEITRSRQRQTALESQRDEQQQAIKAALLDAYKQGKQNRVKLILNQQDPAEVERLLKYYEYINKARQKKIDAYLATLQGIVENKAAQEAAAKKIAAQAEVLQGELKQLESAQADRKLAISELGKRIGSDADKLANQELERNRLQSLLNEIEREVANIQLPSFEGFPFGQQKGHMAWPVDGKALNKFGQRKPDSRVRWQGLLIQASEGEDIRAIHDGRVVYADWFAGQGLMLLIDHGDRFMSLYAHNSTILKQTGELVSAGEPIATVGNSGGQSETGLYFEIRSKGKPVDPADWCR
ncbi:MAG: peptidoglycan DD-metalloendopeptidase family protein [Pseudomonadota bacterium]